VSEFARQPDVLRPGDAGVQLVAGDQTAGVAGRLSGLAVEDAVGEVADVAGADGAAVAASGGAVVSAGGVAGLVATVGGAAVATMGRGATALGAAMAEWLSRRNDDAES